MQSLQLPIGYPINTFVTVLSNVIRFVNSEKYLPSRFSQIYYEMRIIHSIETQFSHFSPIPTNFFVSLRNSHESSRRNQSKQRNNNNNSVVLLWRRPHCEIRFDQFFSEKSGKNFEKYHLNTFTR